MWVPVSKVEVNRKKADWKREKEKQMKKIVDNKLYDTDTAESLGEWRHTFSRHSLYRTKKGAFFVVTISEINDESEVLPLSEDGVFDWLVNNGGDTQAAVLFPERIEEA